ncbi:hypothetical protein DFH08DRAFT_1084230 [Mycena albidolilacea]|uniref:Uncharacterized protein n=1 Tax=Mycena albidolilacea TaxID=1033008 RepID=A0AAD7EKQ2_9AGAR|nr:hypothetical protein DFH08DRAFT_1084230 [Mycena albidolilacea]
MYSRLAPFFARAATRQISAFTEAPCAPTLRPLACQRHDPQLDLHTIASPASLYRRPPPAMPPPSLCRRPSLYAFRSRRSPRCPRCRVRATVSVTAHSRMGHEPTPPYSLMLGATPSPLSGFESVPARQTRNENFQFMANARTRSSLPREQDPRRWWPLPHPREMHSARPRAVWDYRATQHTDVHGRPFAAPHRTRPRRTPAARPPLPSRSYNLTIALTDGILDVAHRGRNASPKSRGDRPSQRFPGSALEPPSMHSHQRRDAHVPRGSQPALKPTSTASTTLRDRTQPCANCRLTHRCFARRIAHACSSPKRRPIPASPPASSKPPAARTVASLTVLSPYTPALDPHYRRLLSRPIPAGLDARPITDGAALKQTLALAASGHVRDPAAAIDDSNERARWVAPLPLPSRRSPRSSTSNSISLTQAHGPSLKGEYSNEDGPTKADASVGASRTTPTPPRNDVYVAAEVGIANGSHAARMRTGAIRAEEKDEWGEHYGPTTTSRSCMPPPPVFRTRMILESCARLVGTRTSLPTPSPGPQSRSCGNASGK